MAKKRAPPAAAVANLGPKKTNPFDIKKSKTRWDAIGKKVKGAHKNVVKAKQEAINKRKKTLLVEYKQLRKANSFIDRRFGESDEGLSEDQKALARFQAQRLKESKKKKGKAGKFTLGDDDGENGGLGASLTHGGRSLAELEDLNDQPYGSDIDDEVAEELMKEYNFGGGADEDTGAEGAGDGTKKPKTRKEIMEEIIAKSKAFRAEKAKQKEADEEEMEALEASFKDLAGSAALRSLMRPPGANKGIKTKAETQDDQAYDVMARELAMEARGQAGERTLTPEELAAKEQARLEKLEKERQRRMRGQSGDALGDDEEEGEADAGGAQGGYAAKRERKRKREREAAKRADRDQGDEDDDEGEDDDDEDDDDDDDEGDEDEDGLSKVEKRRRQQAAGDHHLQVAFREQAAKLMEKFGIKAKRKATEGSEDEDEEGEEDEDEEGEDEEGESGSEEGESEDDEGESEDEGEGKEGSDEEEVEEEAEAAARYERAHPKEAPSTSQPATAVATAKATKQPRAAAAAAAAVPAMVEELPYTIPLPQSYEAFRALVDGRGPEELATAVSRIRAFNAVALATDNKRKLQEFYGVLVQHFATLAGRSPLPMAHLDTMLPILMTITAEVPFYAATVARARIKKLHERLQAALSGDSASPATAAQQQQQQQAPQQGGARSSAGVASGSSSKPPAPESPWPGPRALLQLKLFCTLFPVTDRRHPVVTPAVLLLGKYLSHCPVSTPHEAATALSLCSMLLHATAPAQRHAPEVPAFLTDLLRAFLPAGGAATAKAGTAAIAKSPGAAAAASEAEYQRIPPGLLCPKAPGPKLQQVEPLPLPLAAILGMPPSDPSCDSDAFRLALLRATLLTVQRSAEVCGAGAALPELFRPALGLLARLGKALRLPGGLESTRQQVMQTLRSKSDAVVSSRLPLVRAAASAAPIMRELNPRFEDGFVAGRDYDPDRQRAEVRKLKRQVAKERRGAVRELRRDAAFMADQRDRERAVVDAERLDSERKFYSELQQLESDMKSGGQKGMNPHLKKKKK